MSYLYCLQSPAWQASGWGGTRSKVAAAPPLVRAAAAPPAGVLQQDVTPYCRPVAKSWHMRACCASMHALLESRAGVWLIVDSY
jgi:hypothetical protein